MNVCLNGNFYPAAAPLLQVQNRSFKWGDGVFETMKMFHGKLLLENLHFERLFSSLQLLSIERRESFTKNELVGKVLQLCKENHTIESARIRLAVFRTEDNKADYTIEAIPLDLNVNQWQQEGQVLTLFPFARKSMDAFANIKSANFLPYVLAQRYAVEKGADDALVLNAQNFLCDSSRANLFLVKNKEVFTPALHQGCVNGIMRRVVIEEIKKLGYRLHQEEVTEEQLLQADEVFLTNAIQTVRWVKTYKQTQYSCEQTQKIFEAVFATIVRGLHA